MLCLDDSMSGTARGLSTYSSLARLQQRTVRQEREEHEQMVERVAELNLMLEKAYAEKAVLREAFDQATKIAEAQLQNVTAAEKQLRLALEAAVVPPLQKMINQESRISSDPELSTSYSHSMRLIRGKPILAPVLTLR